VEFNVLGYATSLGGKAVLLLQLAYQFPPGSSPGGIERFKKIRASWLNQASAYGMKAVQTALVE
jgi:hypothetical protein